MFGVVPLICAKKGFINQADAKGEWGWGGGRRTGLRKVKAPITIVRGSPNRVTLMKFKGLLRYQKPHVTDNISIYAFAYNVQYADNLYCCLYSNIRYNIQCRITNFLHCVSSVGYVRQWVVFGPMCISWKEEIWPSPYISTVGHLSIMVDISLYCNQW